MKKDFQLLLLLFLIATIHLPESVWAGVGMVTGFRTGTYIQFGNDIANVAENYGLMIDVKESEGSISNIERMNSRENAAFGIVQSDVMGFLLQKEPEIAQKLSMIFPFYSEEVHILTSKKNRRISDLKGKSISTGTQGSGSWLTFANLRHIMDINPVHEVNNLEPLDALIAVLEGKIDALIYVAGKPVKLFSKLELLYQNPDYRPLIEQVHFLPLNDSKMLRKYYVESRIMPSDYSWLKEQTPTIAVKALLVSYDFSTHQSPYYESRCRQIGRLAGIIRENFNYLKENGHEKWKAVDLDAEIGSWKQDACSQPIVPAKNEPKIVPRKNESKISRKLREIFQE